MTEQEATTVNTRKYESGTTIDQNRLFRSFEDGEVFDLEETPSAAQIRTMIRTDAQAKQLSQALKLPVRSARFDIIPGKGDKGEAEFIEYALLAPAGQGGMTTPFRQVLTQMANALEYRFAAFEKVWKVQDRGPHKGKVMLHKLGYRPSATCSIMADKNGSFNGFIQRVVKGEDFKELKFKPNRSLVYIHEAHENPLVGTSPFETMYYAWLNKKKVEFFYYAFLENVAFPKTVAKIQGDDPEELQFLLQKTKKLGSQGIIGLFDTEEIESYESQRNTRDYQTAMEYLDWQMAKACLAQFLDLGGGQNGERGSYALAENKSNFFFMALESMLTDIAATINNYLIADLVNYNFGVDAVYPEFKFRPLNDESAEPVLDIFKNVMVSQTPNITAPFMLKLMQRVAEITDLKLDPMEELSEEAIQEIRDTIPTAREEMESKENRAGSGQNAVTGLDRNNNNKTPQSQEPAKTGAPTTPKTPSRKNEREDSVEQGRA